MSLCNFTIQKLESKGYDGVSEGKTHCPVEGCGLPVARHRDESAPQPLPQAGKCLFRMTYDVLRKN